MSLVDTTTGEITEIADERTANELANRLTSAIAHMNARTGQAIDAYIEAYNAKIWIALGFGSWGDLVEARGWAWKPLTSGERATVGEVLRTNGMSFRAIGKLMGASHQTVRRDLEGPTPAEVDGPYGPSTDDEDEAAEFAPTDNAPAAPPAPDLPDSTDGDDDEGVTAPLPRPEPVAPSVEPDPTSAATGYANSWMRAARGDEIAQFDAERLADVAALLPGLGIDEQVAGFADIVARFAARYAEARKPGALKVIAGGRA